MPLGRIYILLGDFDTALRWLEYDPPHVWLPWLMRSEPRVPQDLRQHPRFQALLRKMNLWDPVIAGNQRWDRRERLQDGGVLWEFETR